MHSPALRASGIGRSRGARTLWADLDLAIEVGSSVAVTGPSGTGKSTLVRCLGLLEPVDSGRIELFGETVTRIGPRRRAQLYRSTVGHLFQNAALEDDWTVRQNLDVAFIGSGVRRAARISARQEALAQVGIGASERARAHTLSGGERQRLAIARLLIRRPPVVFADEPTAALDVDTGAEILRRLTELREAGSAIVVATHDPAVMDWADDRLDLAPSGAL